MEILSKKQKVIVVVLIIFMCLIIGYYFINKTQKNDYSELETIAEEKEQEEEIIDEDKIVVHITGEVENEGIIELEKGARISDAIEKAGGTTEEANIADVNLAYSLKDGQKIKIPNINEEDEQIIKEEAGEDIIIEGDNKKEEKININTANQTELETLSGIGPLTALKIINYKKEHGKFNNIEEIKNVPGIGESKFENIKEYICVE